MRGWWWRIPAAGCMIVLFVVLILVLEVTERIQGWRRRHAERVREETLW